MSDVPLFQPLPEAAGADGDAELGGHDFLGRGWRFPSAFSVGGGVALSAYEKKVAESLRIILGTARGERVMRPDFGCGIHELVFQVANESTLALIRAAIEEALILWEPRIELLGVRVEASPGLSLRASATMEMDPMLAGIRDGALVIRVDYRVRTTNNEFNLVYPFYLRQGA